MGFILAGLVLLLKNAELSSALFRDARPDLDDLVVRSPLVIAPSRYCSLHLDDFFSLLSPMHIVFRDDSCHRCRMDNPASSHS